MADDLPVGSSPALKPDITAQGSQSRYRAERCSGGGSRAVWEVIDRTRKPLSRVICRTNRADAMMIVGALNSADRAEAIIQGERDARQLLSDILRQKDEAMGVLFARLSAAHVDCSDLIS